MISEIKQDIAQKIHEQYPSATIYDEDIPQNFKTPSFLVTLIEHTYNKRMGNKFNSTVSIDVAYFSDKGKNEIKSDCAETQEKLLREFAIHGDFRAQNIQANITDNVLHITFTVSYSELVEEDNIKIQAHTLNENIKE